MTLLRLWGRSWAGCSRLYQRLKPLMKGNSTVLLLAWIGGMLEIISRRADMLMNAQPWAEDCSVFVSQALFFGPAAIFQTYEGYYYVIPRLVAAAAIGLSITLYGGLRLVPFLMNLAAVAIASACAIFFVSSRFSWVAPFKWRVVTALLVIGIPASNYGFPEEVYGNITNIQWWLVYFMFLLTWDLLRQNRYPRAWEFSVLVLSALSTSYGIVPVAALTIYYGMKRGALALTEFIPLECLVLVTLIQVASTFGARVDSSYLVSHILLFASAIPRAVLAGMIYPTVVPAFTGLNLEFDYWPAVIIGFLLVVIVYIGFRRERTKLLVPLYFYCAVVAATALGGVVGTGLYYIVVKASDPSLPIAGRYTFLPMTMFITLFVPTLWRMRYMIGCASIGLSLIVWSEIVHFAIPAFADLNWTRNSMVFVPQGSKVCAISINPPWGGWVCSLPCGSPLTSTISPEHSLILALLAMFILVGYAVIRHTITKIRGQRGQDSNPSRDPQAPSPLQSELLPCCSAFHFNNQLPWFCRIDDYW